MCGCAEWGFSLSKRHFSSVVSRDICSLWSCDKHWKYWKVPLLMIPCLDSFHVLHHKGFTFYMTSCFRNQTRPGYVHILYTNVIKLHGKAERKEWTDLQCMTHLFPVGHKPPVLPKIIATVNFCGYTNNMGKYKPNKCSMCDISDRKQWALGQTFIDSDRSISGIITPALYIPVELWVSSCLTFDSYCGTVVPLIGAVCAGSVALIFPLVIRPEPLDDQPDLVPWIPLHSYLPTCHTWLEWGVRETLVPGGHHSHLPSGGIVPKQKPLKVLRTWAFISWHSTGQGEREASDTVEGSSRDSNMTAQSMLEHWKRKTQ